MCGIFLGDSVECLMQVTMETEPVHNTTSQPNPSEQRTLGFTTAPGKAKDTPSWLMLSLQVRQMDATTLTSLSAFSSAVASQYYADANIDLNSRACHSLGQQERVDFWKKDVLAGLLMQAFMLATSRFGSKLQMLQAVSTIAAGIKMDAHDLLYLNLQRVPGVETIPPGTEWLCVFWNFLRVSIDWKGTDTAEGGNATTPPLADLQAKLCETFAMGPALSKAKAKAFAKHARFWHQDCLALTLFKSLAHYISSSQALLDGEAIQQWLSCHSSSAPTQQARSEGLPKDTEGADIDRAVSPAVDPEPVDAATLHKAISNLSKGFSITDLAWLEEQLLKEFQVSLL